MVCLTLSGKLLMILNGLQKQKTKKKKYLLVQIILFLNVASIFSHRLLMTIIDLIADELQFYNIIICLSRNCHKNITKVTQSVHFISTFMPFQCSVLLNLTQKSIIKNFGKASLNIPLESKYCLSFGLYYPNV